jgi:hypothetical protein
MLWIRQVDIDGRDIVDNDIHDSFKHFFNWKTWNTLYMPAKAGGSSK